MKTQLLIMAACVISAFTCLAVSAEPIKKSSEGKTAKAETRIRFVGEGYNKQDKQEFAQQIVDQITRGDFSTATKTFQVLAKDLPEHQSSRSLDSALDVVNDALVEGRSPYYFELVDKSARDNHAVERFGTRFWKTQEVILGAGKTFELCRFTVAYDESTELHPDALMGL